MNVAAVAAAAAAGLVAIVVSYLLGSVPFAVVVSRLMGLPDPRSYGSRNPGATNVLRKGGKFPALLTLLGDSGKGALAVGLVAIATREFGGNLPLKTELVSVMPWCGAAAFLGHLYPVFLRFEGGKGVATFFGVLLAIDLPVGLGACCIWLLMAALFRYSSLASMCSAVAAAAALLVLHGPDPVALAAVFMATCLVWRHRGNIAKLRAGTESRIGKKPA